MPKFLDIQKSERKDKKLVFKMDNPKRTFHFGSKHSQTYVEGANEKKRDGYIKRHRVRENWDEINPGSLSRYLLWGNSVLISENLKDYFDKFDITHDLDI